LSFLRVLQLPPWLTVFLAGRARAESPSVNLFRHTKAEAVPRFFRTPKRKRVPGMAGRPLVHNALVKFYALGLKPRGKLKTLPLRGRHGE
jgi:hypothetical protein